MSIPSGKPRIVALVGPTASGKTSLSLEVAGRWNGEIVSTDSRQVYRGMDIGTAKPTDKELRAVPHHLINIKDPDENYTVAEYKEDAVAAIRDILLRGKFPLLVGGTGLYVKAVLENLDIPKIKANPELRKKIEGEIEEKGLAAAVKKLVALDPEAARIVDLHNPRRVVRALEVAQTTGRPFTAQRKKNDPLFDALTIGVNPPPEILRERINARVDQMMKDGFVDEAKRLLQKYGRACQPFDAIGYREIIAFLNGEIALRSAVDQMKLNTWHYARRQMTWFRRDKNVYWINGGREAAPLIKNFLGNS